MNHVSGTDVISTQRGVLSQMMRVAVFFLVALHLVLTHPPWRFGTPTPQLDSSWQQVVAHAAASGWQWGRDIAFTFGPLGFAWNAFYLEPLLAQTLFLKTVFLVALAFGIIGMLRRTRTIWVLPLYALIAFAGSMLGPGLYSIIPLLAALNYFCDPDDTRLRWVIPLVIVGGLLALTYVSSGVMALLIFLLMDLSRLQRRRVPIFVPLMASASLVGFILAGQSLSTLTDYLRSSFELISGYSDAMSLEGRPYELAVFVALTLIAAAFVVRCEFSSLRDPRLRGDSMLLLGCMSVYWFAMFKTGFVRHDLHSIWSWSALAIGIAAYLAIRPFALFNRTVALMMLGLAAAACSLEAMCVHPGVDVSFIGIQARSVFLDSPSRGLSEAHQLLMDTAAWRKAMEDRRESARAAVKLAYADLRIPTTVDMMGISQGALLLQDVDFRPRPVFQDFAAYTPWLIEINRAHLRGPRAAQTMLLSTETPDNHYPMMDRSNAVLELLALYRPERLAAGFLVLRRRDAPLELTLTPPHERDVAIGQWVDVPASGLPIILSADVRPNALGLLAKLIYRLPTLDLTVRLADGKEHSHRFVAAIGREGMLLSPYIEGVVSFAAMAAGGAGATGGTRVVAFKITVLERSGPAYFMDQVHVSLRGIRMPAVEEPVPPELGRSLDRQLVANRLANSVVPRDPHLDARETMLLAHPPVTANLAVSSAHKLEATYAISDAAWQNGNATDGVCFHIYAAAADGERVKLHERCLRPVEREEDRGEQRVSLQLSLDNPGTLLFETDCGGNCSWDWAYWKDIDVLP